MPHADDEILTFGVSIIQDLREGKEVYTILISHGDRTGALHKINRRITPDLTSRQLGQARVNELIEATKRMGIDEDHKIIYDFVVQEYGKEREIDQTKIRTVLSAYAKEYPQAEFKTMSVFDTHPDHAMLGRVLQELKEEKIIHHF